MTWPLAPPNPKLFTPTTALPALIGWVSCTGANPRPEKSIAGFGGRPWSDGGIVRCPSTRMAFRTPAIPEAGSMWPRFVFTEPIGRRWPAERSRPNARPIASHSRGSPTGVPVPWASR